MRGLGQFNILSARAALWTFLVAAVLVPGGCADPERASETLVLSFGRSSPEQETLLLELATRFEAAHPGVRVRIHPLRPEADFQRALYLRSLTERGELFDVVELRSEWTAELAAAGTLATPPEPEAERAPEDAVREAASFRGRMEALPVAVSLSLLYYRADLLEKHAIAVPTSLQELADASLRLSQAEGVSGFVWPGEPGEDLTCVFLETYRGMGGRVRLLEKGVFLEGQLVRQAVGFLVSLLDSGASPSWVTGADEAEGRLQFLDGDAAFLRDRDDFLVRARSGEGRLAANVGVAVLPGRTGDRGVSTLDAWHLAVNRSSRNRELAGALAEFLASSESQGLVADRMGRTPAFRDVPRAAVWQGAAGEVLDAALSAALPRPASPYYFELSRIIREEVHAALRHDKSVDSASDKLVERVRSVSGAMAGGASSPVLPNPSFLF